MKVKFNHKFKSITDFAVSTIQDFSIFLGVNGSGKTHLLKAIKEGSVLVNDIPVDRVSYFSAQMFKVGNQKQVTPLVTKQ